MPPFPLATAAFASRATLVPIVRVVVASPFVASIARAIAETPRRIIAETETEIPIAAACDASTHAFVAFVILRRMRAAVGTANHRQGPAVADADRGNHRRGGEGRARRGLALKRARGLARAPGATASTVAIATTRKISDANLSDGESAPMMRGSGIGARARGTSTVTYASSSRGTAMRALGGDDEDADGLVSKPLDAGEALRRAYFPVLVAAFGAFSFGYHCGVVNPALETLARDIGIVSDVAAKGAVVSSMLFGAAAGSFIAGGLADKIGRKSSLSVAGVALAIGSVACATAMGLSSMLAGRAFAGLGVGLVSILVPMYISELAPPAHRGILGAGPQLSIGLGILISVLLGLPLQDPLVDPSWWRTMFWIALAPAAALAVFAKRIPESPSWLRSKGRFEEADGIEIKQFGDVNAENPDGNAPTKVATWREVLQAKTNRRALLTGPTLFFIQQFAGINAIIYFSTSIFQSAGIESGVLASVVVCIVNILGSVIATGLLDKMGRKPLLSYSFLGMSFCCVGLAAAAAFPVMAMAPTLSLVSVIAYVFIFGMGAGPVPGLLSSEIFAPAVRSRGMALCFLSHWFFNFCIGQGFLPAVEFYGASTVYLAFGAFSLLGYIFTQSYIIETKGKSLDQISAELSGK